MTEKKPMWLFVPPTAPIGCWRTVLWWEARRIPFNLIVGGYGFVCLLVFYWGLSTSGHLAPGEDAIEPLALVAMPFVLNVCYTFGWVIELWVRDGRPELSPRFGPRLLKVGLWLSLGLVSLPALSWGGYRVLQLIHPAA